MTTFKIWKVQHGMPEHLPWYLYSLKQEDKLPIVLSEEQFKTLFPEINLEMVPTAPVTAEVEIDAELRLTRG